MLSTQSLLVVQLAFELRQDVIVERFCVNRDRPELNCEGHCQLTKMMRQAQEDDEERQAASLEILLSFHVWLPPALAPTPPAERLRAFAVAAPEVPPSGFPSNVFRPPRAA